MKTYNKSLDYVVLAMEQASKGKPKTAAALFAKALSQPDVQSAIAILEHNNAQAYTAKVEATANAKKVKVKAAEEKALDHLVGDQDEEGKEVEAEAEPEGEPEEVEDEAVEDEDKTDDKEALAKALFAKALAELIPTKKK